jgi:uncharacterized protein YndB with AHSA1/START domain
MPRARRTIVIHRPVDEVFAFFADPSNDPKWRPLVKEISADQPLHIGSTVHQLIKGPGGRAFPSDFEVAALEAPTRYAFKVTQGPVRPTGDFQFTPVGSDTEITVEISAELHGLKKLLLAGPVQRAMDSEVAGLDKAKGTKAQAARS